MRTFHRNIFFTNVPIKGKYIYDDLFQIFPADFEGKPTSELQRHFPCVIEFWTTEDEHVTVPKKFEELKEFWEPLSARMKKLEVYLKLFSAFTNHHFFTYKDSKGSWSLHLSTEMAPEEANSSSSKWCLDMYVFPELSEALNAPISNFSKIELPDIEMIYHPYYFMIDPNHDLNHKKELTLPHSIDQLFKSYFSLEENEREAIETACSFCASAAELKELKKTLSLLACFTALETMVNVEFKNFKPERCESCSQEQFKIAHRFRTFLMKYLGESDHNKKKFNKYYSLRSKIVHTGKELKSESLFSEISDEEEDEEYITRIEVLQITRLAIANWLYQNENRIIE